MAKLNRRDVIKSFSAIGAFVLPVSGFATRRSFEQQEIHSDPLAVDKGQLVLRKKARLRTRRIIMNNDGNDVNIQPDLPASPEHFLNRRTLPLLGSHVDSIFYCDGVNNQYTHRSRLTDLPEKREEKMHTVNTLLKYQTDPLEVMVNCCRQYNKEIFWSMRMNDTHDAASRSLSELTKWKREHPEYLMGKPGVKDKFLNKWSALNYGLAPVRERVLQTITDVIANYDVDGVELDFFRHPVFFMAQCEGGHATEEDCRKMSQLVRSIRRACDAEGAKRGRPVLLSVRIPDSVPFAKALGLDVLTWCNEELVDLMAAGCYFKMEPWKNWADLGLRFGIPVYAVLEGRRLSETLQAEDRTDVERWRAEALFAWKAGVNGIYTFNRFKPHDQIFHELGDMALLQTLSRKGKESYISPAARGVVSPDTWLKDARRFLKKNN